MYEQERVESSLEKVERPFPSMSVSGQTREQSSWRALSVKARVDERSDKTETTTAAEKIMLGCRLRG